MVRRAPTRLTHAPQAPACLKFRAGPGAKRQAEFEFEPGARQIAIETKCAPIRRFHRIGRLRSARGNNPRPTRRAAGKASVSASPFHSKVFVLLLEWCFQLIDKRILYGLKKAR